MYLKVIHYFLELLEVILLYGKPDATDDEIITALTSACAIDFVNELEDGLDTMIGEKGVGISEGQAQRIAIARSFLRVKTYINS